MTRTDAPDSTHAARDPRSGEEVRTDVCIIGAGPAGIVMAAQWTGSDRRVLLLESGGDLDPAPPGLSDGPVTSGYHARGALERGRVRQFGGTSNLWGYRSQPEDGRHYARAVRPEAVDLEPREGIEGSGWPLTMEDLRPYHDRATAWWVGEPTDDAVETWDHSTAGILDVDPRLVTTRIVRHGAAEVFRHRDLDTLAAAENITVRVGCTVVALGHRGSDANHVTRIDHAVVVDADGARFTVRANVFVLAAGGIENAQLLLLSEAGRPGGPANRHDAVGRWITDHPEFRWGMVELDDPAVIDRLGLYDLRWVGPQLVAATVTLPEAIKREEGLLNVGLALAAQVGSAGSAAHRSAAALRAITRRERPADVVSHVRTLATHPIDTARLFPRTAEFGESSGGWSRPEARSKPMRRIELYAATEQSIDRENRVTLDTSTDRLGRPRPRLRWSWTRRDRDNVERSLRHLESAIGAAIPGRFDRWVTFEGPGRPHDAGYHHPMGSTRMHPDPRFGVVDSDARVHGLDNLYVTGSSVFPSGHGFANPTLTVIALTLRLADHLIALIG